LYAQKTNNIILHCREKFIFKIIIMKRKLLYFTVVVVIAMATSWNVSRNISKTAMSDVALANVEALSSEIGDACGGCSSSCSGQFCCLILINGTGFALNRCS
jgi:hypothetical protein